MRKFVITFLAVLSANFLFAQYSNLKVYTENGEKFTLVVDGIEINSEPSTVVTATEIDSNRCYVQVIFNDKKKTTVAKDVKFLPMGNEFSLCVEKKKKKKKKGPYKIRKVKSEPIFTDVPSYEILHRDGSTMYIPDDYEKDLLPGYKGRVVGNYPIKKADFSVLVNKIPTSHVDGDQVAIALEVFFNESLLVSQIISIMNRMTFDYNKMEIAKFAWLRVYDINNFALVFKHIENHNYVDELFNFIQQNPR